MPGQTKLRPLFLFLSLLFFSSCGLRYGYIPRSGGGHPPSKKTGIAENHKARLKYSDNARIKIDSTLSTLEKHIDSGNRDSVQIRFIKSGSKELNLKPVLKLKPTTTLKSLKEKTVTPQEIKTSTFSKPPGENAADEEDESDLTWIMIPLIILNALLVFVSGASVFAFIVLSTLILAVIIYLISRVIKGMEVPRFPGKNIGKERNYAQIKNLKSIGWGLFATGLFSGLLALLLIDSLISIFFAFLAFLLVVPGIILVLIGFVLSTT
ncbi:MAG: hypothetical protein GC181_11075 [Bacteroidetes bacterium]|nr:hypothetical protein [Bacteroidota bacterium]